MMRKFYGIEHTSEDGVRDKYIGHGLIECGWCLKTNPVDWPAKYHKHSDLCSRKLAIKLGQTKTITVHSIPNARML